jgi:predicted HAD superfamily Cof-like phosphohydrolase
LNQVIQKVQQFHETFHCYINTEPTGQIPEAERDIRVKLIQEELDEYQVAAQAGDIVAIADALSDLLYVVCGTYLAHGLQDLANDLFDEVHRSNMSKLDEDGQPIFRDDGKVLKSARFIEPDLHKFFIKK